MNQSTYLSSYLPHIYYLSDIHLSVIHYLLVIHHIVKVIHLIYFAGHSMLGWGGTEHKAWGKGQLAGDSLRGSHCPHQRLYDTHKILFLLITENKSIMVCNYT